jgi:hypothetical protein
MTGPSPRALRRLETGLTAAGGAVLGAAAGLVGGVPLAAAAGASAGLNGVFGGHRQIYNWRSPEGWLAFAADSTWGLVGTTLGNLLNVANSAAGRSGFRPDFSRRQNRQVFEHGLWAKRGFAMTHGNVISNAAAGRAALVEAQRPFIDRHETLHIWQSRLFGPLYQAVYVLWFIAGTAVGVGTWALQRERPPLRRLVETAAYYDNPFEFWAYRRDHHWDDNRADLTLKWRRPRWFGKGRASGGGGAGRRPATDEEDR